MNSGQINAAGRAFAGLPLLEGIDSGVLQSIAVSAELVAPRKAENLDWSGSTPVFYVVIAGRRQE
jgi:hypothetical protein